MSFSAENLPQTHRLHLIKEPSEQAVISYDIIAVHGVGGDWDQTWTSDTGFNWLRQPLPQRFPVCRILSYDCPALLQYLGPSSDEGIEQLKFDLTENRQRADRLQHPIIFIAHSLGGILVKQLFIRTHPSRSSSKADCKLHNAFYGLIFLGTPHQHHVPPNIDELWRTFEFRCEDSLGGSAKDFHMALESASNTNDEFFRFGGENVPAICFFEGKMIWVGIKEMYIVPENRALLRSRVVDGGGLLANHFDLTRFDDSDDENLRRFISSFDNFVEILSDPIDQPMVTDAGRLRGLKLLSLDGGGVKGLFSVLVLRSILQETQRLVEGRKLPCEIFDLIGGTSTGGLLAIMLGRLEMDVPACIDTYRQLSKGIFQRNDWIPPLKKFVEAALSKPWFSGERLKKAICSTVMEQISTNERENMEAAGLTAENIRFLSIEHQKTRCFVCAVREGEHEAQILRSYRTYPIRGHDASSYTIWQAARATSAGPMYFPAIDIQRVHYFDGGLSCNNPVMNVLDEARAEFPDTPISPIISIGTGKSAMRDPHGSVLNIVHSVISRATDTEVNHNRIMQRSEYDDIRGGYFRFQEEDVLGEIDLADASRLDEIEELTNRYLAKEAVKTMIAACAQRLLDM